MAANDHAVGVDGDRRAYLAFLKERCETYGVRILSYCLTTNHMQLITVPRSAEGLAKAVGHKHFLRTQYVNRPHGRSGHLWSALRDIERNPLRARPVRLAWRYPQNKGAA